MEIGGINANEIVTSLLQIERQPLTVLESRRTSAQDAARALTSLRTSVEAFRLASAKLSDTSSLQRHAATVSNPSAVSAKVTAGATPGSLTFSVDQLASTHGLRSLGTVAANNLPITSDPFLALAKGTAAIGVGTVRAGTGLAAGSFTLSVVQASQAARTTGSAPLAASTVIGPGNDTIELDVNGTSHSITLTAGTYDRAALAAHVDDRLAAAGIAASASVGDDGRLTIASNREGSAASLQITGGDALGSLGLGIDATTRVGTDGVIDVGGTTTTFSSIDPGSSGAVDTGAGTLDINLSSGLRVGTSKVTVVGTGTGSLVDVTAAINGANVGISAAAVRIDGSNWRLQLGSSTTGSNGELAIDGDAFSAMGGLVESSAARNARITIGDGPGAYSVEASGNTFNDVMAGVSFTASAVTTSPVTVRVARDDDAIAADVSKMVSAANTLLAEIKVQTRYDVATKASGALAGNSSVRRLADQIRAVVGRPVDGNSSTIASDLGIQSTRDGSFTFDKATFVATLADRPDAVAQFLGRGASTPAGVTFSSATSSTVTGSYDVEVTTPASRAASTTLFAGGAASDSRIGFRIGDITATYDVTAGQTPSQIIDGINAKVAAAGLRIVAESDGTGIRVRSDVWGTAGSFETNLDVTGAGTWDLLAGVNVEGTIDGLTALGVGRTLTLNPLTDGPAAGLSVEIGDGVTGVLGAVAYQPGLAARIEEFTTALTDSETGFFKSAGDAANRRVTDFNDQIDRFEDRLAIRETNLRRQWANLQSLLEGLQKQGSFVSSQLASLPNYSKA